MIKRILKATMLGTLMFSALAAFLFGLSYIAMLIDQSFGEAAVFAYIGGFMLLGFIGIAIAHEFDL